VEALLGEDRGSDGEDDGHGADHERGVRDGGEGEAFELEDELEGNAEEGGEEEGAPLRCVKVRAVGEEQREKAEGGEEEAVEDHRADVHFG